LLFDLCVGFLLSGSPNATGVPVLADSRQISFKSLFLRQKLFN
jgi:hypothetical protein